jgi:hypothetical protein
LPQVSLVTLGEPYAITGEPFDGVVGKIGQPRIVFAFQSRIQTDLILIDLPGNAVFFETFGKSVPIRRIGIVHIIVQHIGGGGYVLFLPDRPGPKKEPVGCRSGQRRTKMLITDGKGIRK